jgi:replicative DNA helicase
MKMTTKPNFQTAADVFDNWKDDVLAASPPVLYPIGAGELARIEVGPKLVTLIGGPPGAGKTAFTMQAVVDGLRLNPTLRALVCNIEMPPGVLLDRQLARLSGVDCSTIRYRRFAAEHGDRIDQAMNAMEPLAERLAFCRPQFDLANVAASADAFRADLILLDYIQRIPPPNEHGDRRGSVDATMSHLRRFADAGVAVFAVAALSRGKDSNGRSTYAGNSLTLASFRESSELEYGADDAFILASAEDTAENGTAQVTLRHLKARHTEPKDLVLDFDRPCQRFTVAEAPRTWKPEGRKADRGKPKPALGALWDRTPPADEDADQGGESW